MQKSIIILALVAWLGSVCNANDDDDFSVVYDKASLEADIAEKNLFVMFFAPWCGHCKMLKPTWNDLAKQMNVEGSQVTIGMVDCTQHSDACRANGVTGYPTLQFFKPEKQGKGEKFQSQRTIESLKAFIETQLGQEAPEPDTPAEAADVPAVEADNGLYDLTDANFQSHIATGHHFIKFFAPWCGHCKRLAPTWEALAASYKDSDKVKIAKVDCTKHSKVCGSQGVRGYPTLLWFTDGVKSQSYNQARTEDALNGFITGIIGAQAEEEKQGTDGKVPEVKDEEENLVELTDEDFLDTVSEDFTLVMFYDQQCKECEDVKPTLETLGLKFIEKTEFLFAAVDCDAQKKTCEDEEVPAQYPLFKMYHNGNAVDTYTGEKTKEAIQAYMAKKEKDLKPKRVDHGGEL